MAYYTEHSQCEAHGILMADSTLSSGNRMVWVGYGGMNGRWLTHAEFRDFVAQIVKFADGLPPTAPRFSSTSCSSCGGEFGPGNAGFSHCDEHGGAKGGAA